MPGRRMRRAAAAVVAGLLVGLLVGLGSPAIAAHETPVGPTATIGAEITRGNGTVASVEADPLAAGDWHFVAEVSGVVYELFVQLWKPKGSLCAGELIAEMKLSGSDEKPYHRRNVAPGTHAFPLPSSFDGVHCVRVILWGKVEATVVVDAYAPELVDPPLL